VDLKRGVTAGLALAGVVVGVMMAEIAGQPPVATPVPGEETIPTTAQGIVVHVSGWVLAPGVVEVPEGALVVDAVTAAGGALAGARLDAINLARPLGAGDQVEVPGPNTVTDQGGNGGEGLISLNRADGVELQRLPGVGPVLAERIVAYREANGPFERVEDLLDVPGIGEAKLVSIRDLVSVP
jgi:competence protein ComEA